MVDELNNESVEPLKGIRTNDVGNDEISRRIPPYSSADIIASKLKIDKRLMTILH